MLINNDKLEIMHKYKTNKCTNKDCKYNNLPPSSLKEADGLMQFDCFYYHSKSDQRRPSLYKPKTSRGYLANYSQFLAVNCLSQEEALKHCLNPYEYFYHPLNFKKTECTLIKENKCNSMYCPYFHNRDEDKEYEEFRNIIQNAGSFLLPMMDEFKQILKNLNDGLTSPSLISEEKMLRESNLNTDLQKGKDHPRKYSANNGIDISNNIGNTALKKFKTNEGYYILDQTVDFIEDHHHEFKNLKLNLETVNKYICGFLNSKGGILYFGINDSGVIKGIEVNDKQMLTFIRKLKIALLRFEPSIIGDDIIIDFVPISNKKGTKIPNTYIVEIKITKDNHNELYFTDHKECYIKRSASINQLKSKDIK